MSHLETQLWVAEFVKPQLGKEPGERGRIELEGTSYVYGRTGLHCRRSQWERRLFGFFLENDREKRMSQRDTSSSHGGLY